MKQIRKHVEVDLKASNDIKREVLHKITTDSVDRDGDIIESVGATVDNFMKNPVVLRNHSHRTEDMIGKAVSLTIEDHAIWARTKFLDTEIGRQAFALNKAGLGGWSIGFVPTTTPDQLKDTKGNVTGLHFKEWDLLEYSQVAIPANQEIVARAVSDGIVTKDLVGVFFKVETEPSPPVPSAASRPDARAALETKPAVAAISRALATLERADAARRISRILTR